MFVSKLPLNEGKSVLFLSLHGNVQDVRSINVKLSMNTLQKKFTIYQLFMSVARGRLGFDFRYDEFGNSTLNGL